MFLATCTGGLFPSNNVIFPDREVVPEDAKQSRQENRSHQRCYHDEQLSRRSDARLCRHHAQSSFT